MGQGSLDPGALNGVERTGGTHALTLSPLATDLGTYALEGTRFRTSWIAVFRGDVPGSGADMEQGWEGVVVPIGWITAAPAELAAQLRATASRHAAVAREFAANRAAIECVDALVMRPIARGEETSWRTESAENVESEREDAVEAVANALSGGGQDAFRLLSDIEGGMGARLYGEEDIPRAREAIAACNRAIRDPALAVSAARHLREEMCRPSGLVLAEVKAVEARMGAAMAAALDATA